MGGAAAGEIASELAVTTVRDSLMELPEDTEVAQRLVEATSAANNRIWDHARQNPELAGMGATLTAALLLGESAYLAQIGDSRAYLIRSKQIKQLTKDQSLVQLLLESGSIEPEQASLVPQNVIMQALGTQPDVRVAITAARLCPQDCLLICSDGLSNKVTPEEMLSVTVGSKSLALACQGLVDLANERGGEDNITVILAQFQGSGFGDGKRITDSLEALSEDYFSEHAMTTASQFSPPVTRAEDVITLVIPAMSKEGIQSQDTAGEPLENAQQNPDSSPNEEPNPATYVPQRSRTNYRMILLVALLSLLMLAAVIYFYYAFYLKQPAEPAAMELAHRSFRL
jgi:serine/threonine protein phosphatase PrpC